MTDSTPRTGGTDKLAIPTRRFRPLKTHLFIVAFMVVLCIIAIGFSPWLAVTLIAPALYTVWIFRVRTTVGPRGITAVYLFAKRRSVPWSEFKGLFFNKGGRAFAVTTKDERVALPAISFNSLPELKEATDGLIPDPVTPAREAENNKVEVFDRDGYSVLKDKEDD
nr:PH domain-containing protein [Corynebacterium lactis]